MRTVSFQGTQLTQSQRARLHAQAALRAVAVSPLQALVNETLAAVEQRKEQGKPPEKQWTTIINEHGTPWLGDVFGF